ncbi:MAG: ABC transporter permease subunit [Corynebacterium sp.]|uniref:ABC transporter permease n=1 Tax=Corynebacterium sp. TaxID=1720 RepID=UPI0026DF0B4F|nr:ABC transporter permease subunit [Corynebacterium sp.]MDO5669080.1 ABC transporter permease subunit [Corynebacterium sp.]
MAQQLVLDKPQSTAASISTPRNRWGANNTTIAIFIVALVFFFAPWVAAAMFGFSRPGVGFTLEPLLESLQNPRAWPAIRDTLMLTVASTILMLVLLVPTIIFLNMKAPQLAKVAEVLSVLPMVVPAVALVSGVSQFYRVVAPSFINSLWSLVPLYVILAMPLCYRAIDAGVKSLDLRTMFAASSSLGASTWTTLTQVVLPNMRVAMLSASLLSIAMSLAEYAMASLLLHYTFPVFLVQVSNNNPRGIAALSFITIIITWLLLVAISALSRTDKVRKS